MAIGSTSGSTAILSALYSGVTASASTKRVRKPTFTAEQGEGTYTGKLANGRDVSFTVSDVQNGLAKVRYASGGEIKSGQVQINGNILRIDNVQIAVLSGGRARFAGVYNGKVLQTNLQR